MKVTISVPGRFHLFNLAQQLLKRDYLAQLITSYPKFEVARYGIPREKVSSILIKEVIERGWRRLPKPFRHIYNPQYLIHQIFDNLASGRLRQSDIVVGSSSVFSETLKKAKSFKAITVVDRGSSHIVYQNKILREEYERFSIKPEAFQLPHPKIIEKELEEYEKADYIEIPSLFVKRTFLINGVPENKIVHVPYGVNLAQFRQLPKKDSVFRVIFAGGMTLRKGLHYLLQAFSELNLPNSELVLIGSFNEEIRPFFNKYEGKFRWLGHVPQDDLRKYYSEGSVFAILSLEEGLAMVQAQAMACGLPVIFTPNTGGEDIIRDGTDGFIVPIRDVDAVKAKITYLYENPDVAVRMGQSAKERVSRGFTWDDYGSKMVKAYEEILTGKR